MTTAEFIFDTPLYQKETDNSEGIVIDLSHRYDARFPESSLVFDGYNPKQGKETSYGVYKELDSRAGIESRSLASDVFAKGELWFCTLRCLRYGDEIELCLWLDINHSIMKVGQYPSVADMHIGQIMQYKSVLAKEDLKELTRAIGLAANGVGIGSFVYMRRIFEKLINVEAEKALKAGEITKEGFARLRMDEKIEALKSYLPETLVEFKDMYGILSKGIHQLSEQECLAYFDVMRNGIELILEDKLEQQKKDIKRKSTMQAVTELKSKLKRS